MDDEIRLSWPPMLLIPPISSYLEIITAVMLNLLFVLCIYEIIKLEDYERKNVKRKEIKKWTLA